MSQNYDPNASLELELNGEDFRADRYNTILFTFLGSMAVNDCEINLSNFDHVFLMLDDDDEDSENVCGGFVFRGNEAFQLLYDFIIKHRFPRFLDETEVPDCDMQAWERTNFDDLLEATGVPEEWTKNE